MTDQAQADVVAGYPVVRRLGAGGMGAVYLVRHPQLHKLLALKVMTAGADDERARARFLREAALAASLDHPHLVTVYDQDEVDGVLHLTMQHVDGPDLGRLLRRGPLSYEEVAEGVQQIADALDALHDVGLVHRDVKPSNVLVAETAARSGAPYWMLADFGIARALDETSELTGAAFIGSVAYSAPERFRRDPGSRSTDVFALACLAHEALTGAPPFGRDLHSVVGNHARSATPAGISELPPPVADALRAGLALSPQRRSTSAGEFAGALAEALREPWRRSPPARGGRPRRAAAWAVLTSALATAVVVVLVLTGSTGTGGAGASVGPRPTPRLPAFTALPAGVVPGAVASDDDGGGWVTDDAGSRIFHLAVDGAVTSSLVPAVEGRVSVPVPTEVTADNSVPKGAPTTSRRTLRADGDGGVWFADGKQVGRIRSSGAVEVLDTALPALVVDLVSRGSGAWLSLADGATAHVVDTAGRLSVEATADQPPGVRWPHGGAEVRWAVDDGAGGAWVLEGGVLRKVVGEQETDIPLSDSGPLPGTDLVLGPTGALFWLDDTTGRVGRLDPASRSFPEFLRLPAGTVARGMASSAERLLVSSRGPDGRAGVLAVAADGQVADSAVTDAERAAAIELLSTYRTAQEACGVVGSRAEAPAELPCLVTPLRALGDGLAEVALPTSAGLARDDVRRAASDAAAAFTALADPDAVSLNASVDAAGPLPAARVVDVAMSVDRLRTALGLPRGGVVI